MRYLAALLAALGGAILGWTAGTKLFVMLFELLWRHDREQMLGTVLGTYALPVLLAALGFVLVLWLARRPPSGFGASLLLAPLAALSGATLGYVAGEASGYALARAFDLEGSAFKDNLILLVLLGTLGGLAAGALVAGFTRGDRLWGKLGIAVIGALAAVPLFLVCISVQNALGNSRYGRGLNAVMRFEIRLPAGVAQPAKDTVRIDLRGEAEPKEGFLYDGSERREGDRVVLPGFVWLKDATDTRQLAVTLPNEPTRVFRVPLPAKPVAVENYTPWQHADSAADDAFEIRFRMEKER